jgi:hypothetical protein
MRLNIPKQSLAASLRIYELAAKHSVEPRAALAWLQDLQKPPAQKTPPLSEDEKAAIDRLLGQLRDNEEPDAKKICAAIGRDPDKSADLSKMRAHIRKSPLMAPPQKIGRHRRLANGAAPESADND